MNNTDPQSLPKKEIGKSLGLIIGRFQPFHNGHKLLVDTALQQNPATLILIGSSNKQDEANPYSYELRKEMILGENKRKGINIGALPDFSDDAQWIEMILSYIPDRVQKINVYCGDARQDSAIVALRAMQEPLPFTLEIIEIPRSIIPVSATLVRQWIVDKDYQQLRKYIGEKTLLSLGMSL